MIFLPSPLLTKLTAEKRWAELNDAIQCRVVLNSLDTVLPPDEMQAAAAVFETNPQAIIQLKQSVEEMLGGTPATTAEKTSEGELRMFACRQHAEAVRVYEAELEAIRATAKDDRDYQDRAVLVEPPPTERTFRRRLRNKIDRNREHFARTLKTVGKGTPHVCAIGLATKKDQAKFNDRHLARCNVDMGDGESVSLLLLRDNNIKARCAETYAMQKGLEKLAVKHGLILGFATLTLPGEYHANPKSGHRASVWNGSTIRDGHDVLQEAWELLRALCHQDGIVLSGGRCEEPHEDGTAHRHQFFYVDPAHMPTIEQHLLSLQNKLGSIDLRWIQPVENGKPDIHIEMRGGEITERVEVHPTKRASPASYVMKYVYKGLAAEMSSEKAWRSIQGIRAMQWFGVPPLGLWRTLRAINLHHGDDAELHMLARLAKGGDYCGFVEKMGGLGIKQKDRPFQLKILKKGEVEDGKKGFIIKKQNQPIFSYLRDLRHIQGIKKAKTETLITLTTNYSRKAKAKSELLKKGITFHFDHLGKEYLIYPPSHSLRAKHWRRLKPKNTTPEIRPLTDGCGVDFAFLHRVSRSAERGRSLN